MSCNEWERGELKFSAVEFRKFRDAFVAAWNAERAADFERANKLYAALIEAGRGQRKFDWRRAFYELFNKEVGRPSLYAPASQPYATVTMTDFELYRLLLEKEIPPSETQRWTRFEPRTTPVMPKKKDFAPIPATKAASFKAGFEGSVTFDHKARTVTWSVSENNHAIDVARESFVGELFFRTLSRVTWTRGTGGVIYGNNEYNRSSDNEGVGSGGHTLNGAWGPLGEQARDDRLHAAGLRRPRARSSASPRR